MVWERWLRREIALISMAALVLIAGSTRPLAQEVDLAALHGQVSRLIGQGKYTEAIPLAERMVALARQKHGEHGEFATSITVLAELYRAQGLYAEAEPLYQRSLSIREKALGPHHSNIGTSLNNLAELYREQGRFTEAEPIYQRALIIFEKTLGPEHTNVATLLNNLAELYRAQSRYAEAEPMYRRAVAIYEKALGPDHPNVGFPVNNLALLYGAQGRHAEAARLQARELSIREKALGPDHPIIGTSLNNLAGLYYAQARYAEAEPLLQRSLSIREKALGPDHPLVGSSLNNLAGVSLAQRDWLRAANYWRQSTALLIRRSQRGTADVGQALTGKKKTEAEQLSSRFWLLVKVGYRLASEGGGNEASLQSEMFQTAQWARGSEAAASLAQMAARGAKGDPGLAALVRERQDLVDDWQKRDGARSAAVARAPDNRNHAAEAANIARLADIDKRIADIDRRLAADFPEYSALARPTPLSIEEVQAQLAGDEALVLFLDTPQWHPLPEETFIWVVTKTGMRWVRTELGTATLMQRVTALRCGLDLAAWYDGRGATCAALLGVSVTKPPEDSSQLKFSVGRAYALYRALFNQVEDLIRDKHLLIVPSGALTQLPFHVLATEASSGSDYRSVRWLARKHAVTVLPAVSSLKALRRFAKGSAASKPMLGIGNPLLDGDPANRPWEAEWARLALQKQTCPQAPWPGVASLPEKRRAVARVPTRRGRADGDHLRSQSPLHDTADELCAVANVLNLAPDDTMLGGRATEAAIKRLSGEGRLAGYRVVHFATHGTLSGEIEGTSEPGLILTPPKEQSDEDDGYLSASEVAALKLDADWVILSACNTAAGGSDKADALSGLARAFFYAGARALLVSHWAVDSAATVKLVSHAVGATARDKGLGRAEALRRSMLDMIDLGDPRDAHPALWSPFIVVGEGAASK